ncbi:hypothetical protein FHW69_002839 [Luteibacter sp. Sphag1AF]|uniref:autotransporter outer membrane beta-barrel domain-containing protein n=1 Tax=Luteibacter sp. Sphag1AF TaxID=2587031 RepID=UPI001618E769|nr:autotransporter outer membrane beta-barrel domain-containing protein [Luteibacter sp. Sphag1AF]MBB3228204.1 hypothetical protein [Luteibacter sp. Sphag1AF]
MAPIIVGGSRPPAFHSHARFPRRTPLALLLGALLPLSQSFAQTIPLSGAQGAYANNQTGQSGADGQGDDTHPQDGSPAPGGPVLSVELTNGARMTSGGTSPTLSLLLAGGTGGKGTAVKGGNYGPFGGNGGQGGTPDLLQFVSDLNTTITSSTTGPAAVVLQSTGGAGGYGGSYTGTNGDPGKAGAAGNGGDVTANLSGSIISTNGWSGSNPGTTALLMSSTGGAGGGFDPAYSSSGTAQHSVGDTTANAGAAGGAGGNVSLATQDASFVSAGTAIELLSQGGQGSEGVAAYSPDTARGGNGGTGGTGGAVTATITGEPNSNSWLISAVGSPLAAQGNTFNLPHDDGTVETSFLSAGVSAQSLGGGGGTGGDANGTPAYAGTGGKAGDGGAVTLTLGDINVTTKGYTTPALLAQSIGGSGGDGADAGSVFKSKAGNGADGGNGGNVVVQTYSDATSADTQAAITTNGDDSSGIVAQSIGGGGGAGGDATANGVLAGMSVGGKGEQGGLGGTVTVVNGQKDDGTAMPGLVILTHGDRSDGISAMSIGGGGGSGGNASTFTAGAFTMTVGGTGGSGGNAGTRGTQQVNAVNNGIIQTNGAHSIGMQALAVGGGGGNGGSASSIEGGAQLDVTLAVGGAGGSAGTAGDVYSTNNGQILTQGSDAFGMQVLSVGGGGGNGGASKAAAYQLLNTGEVPSLDFNLSIGGQGGGGGDGGNVQGTNNFSIVTSGSGSHGLEVQSIGGGGGNGGDSSSTQTSTKGSTINVNLAIGGDGKGGGTGGQVTATNNGLIWTMAGDSDAIFAQSVGGGGGNGGTGYADTSQFADNDSKKSGQLQLSVGGNGGSGDAGGDVTATNAQGATIITMGDSARGIFAQSVGGIGGNGSGGQSNGSSGTLDARVAVGGNGGNGNVGGTVTVNNAGTIVTGGGDSAGVYAESVGGGGGNGGKAGTAGGNDPQTQLFNYLQASLPSVVSTYSNKTDGFVPNAAQLFDKGVNWTVNLLKGYYQNNAANGAKPQASGAGGGDLNVSLTVGGGFAGKGGSGDTGGDVYVNNAGTGAIQTLGPMSDGIFALSVGGGGGDGGTVAASNNTSTTPSKLNVTVAVGGRGGSAGDGGNVSVLNNGSVTTAGSGSLGIFAGSFGGGGGTGGVTATSVLNGSNTLQTVNVELGGDAGATGNGQDVTVLSIPAVNQAAPTQVSTTGSYAAGIGAMSVGGGGGLVTLNGTVTDPTTGGAVSTGGLQMSGFQLAGKDQAVVCGGQALASCGDGGSVTVTAQNVQTMGQDSPGIVAQSIGGGGGWVQGVASNAQNYFSASSVNGMSGDGHDASVNVQGHVATSGSGAYGVIAQSIGGAGLLGGDLSSATGAGAFTPETTNWLTKGSIGNGGTVLVNVPTGASVTTTGTNAIGVFAQSVGGGGGLVASENTAYMGTAGGTGTSGQVTVNVGGKVTTMGEGATAIYVNADGNTASSSATAVNVTGEVTATGAGSDAIIFNSNAASNTVTNSGLIGYSGAFGSAIVAERGNVEVTNQASGTLYGRISLGSGGTLSNAGTWVLPTGSISLASSVDNTGTMIVGKGLTNGGSVPGTYLDSYLVLDGTLETYVDFANKQDSELTVAKGASLVGTIQINPVTMAPNTVAVLSVPTSLGTGDYKVVDASNYLFQYTPTLSNGVLSVTPQAKLASTAQEAGLSRNAQQLANHLQANFDAGVTALSPLYSVLDQVKDPAHYAATLNGLGAESLQMVGVARINASESFVNRMNACPNNGDTPADQREHDCVWGRVTDQVSNADGEGDGYHLNEHVVQMGGQHEFADGWWVGGSVAYNNGTESASSGVGGVTDHGFSIGGVVKREMGNWTFTGAMDASQGSYQSARNLQLVDQRIQATGSFDGTNIGLHSRISYLFSDSSWYVRPYLDLHLVNVHTDSFQESTAGAIGLKVAAGNGTIFAATPMIEAGDRFTFDNGVQLRPSVGVGRAFYSGNSWNTDMRLAGSSDSVGSFNSAFNAPRQMNQYDAALDLTLNAHSELRLDYTGQFGNGYRMNEGALKYTYFF